MLSVLCSLALLGLANCPTVYALGDSNTCFGWPCFGDNWPEQLAAMLRTAGSEWQVQNRSVPGMGTLSPRNAQGIGEGEPPDAPWHLEKLLVEEQLREVCAHSLVPVGPPPKLALALGTNDLIVKRNFTIAEGILALKRRVEQVAPCVEVYVALMPPRYGDTPPAVRFDIAYVNVLLRARVPPERILDFFTEFTADLFQSDGVHLNHEGKQKRAEIAFEVMFPELERPEPVTADDTHK